LTPEEEAEAIGEDDVILEEDSRSHTDHHRGTQLVNGGRAFPLPT
jgi:DNA polymerase-3 subunit gamma/tau